jgi:hypothetical protein
MPALVRRTFLKGAGAMAMALGTQLVCEKAGVPRRIRLDGARTTASTSLPDIQFEVGAYIDPPQTLSDGGGNVLISQPPVHTVFTTARLNRPGLRQHGCARRLEPAQASVHHLRADRRVLPCDAGQPDLQNQFGVDPDDNGLERFLTATRRQNFLVPPRRNRAFPLVELT